MCLLHQICYRIKSFEITWIFICKIAQNPVYIFATFRRRKANSAMFKMRIETRTTNTSIKYEYCNHIIILNPINWFIVWECCYLREEKERSKQKPKTRRKKYQWEKKMYNLKIVILYYVLSEKNQHFVWLEWIIKYIYCMKPETHLIFFCWW